MSLREFVQAKSFDIPPTPEQSEERHAYAIRELRRFFPEANREVLEAYFRTTALTEDQMLRALSSPAADAQQLEGQEWYQLAARLLRSDYLETCRQDIPECEGLWKPLYPFLHWAESQSQKWTASCPANWGTLRPCLLRVLSEKLAAVTSKSLVLETRIQALREKESGSNPGAGQPVRDSSSASSHHRKLQFFFLRYSGLTRLACELAVNWSHHFEEMFERLRVDRSAIHEVFPELMGLELRAIHATGSDPHDHGRQVVILEFEGGVRLVYKPRPVGIDAAYQNLLKWLGQTGLQPEMRALRVLDCGGHGWIEYAENESLTDTSAAERFYQRQGIHLALIYILKGTDFHHENVIASGEHPILVDLETLLHRDAHSGATDRISPAQEALRNSIYTSGLLPGWSEGSKLSPGPDISGIGTREGQSYRLKGEVIELSPDGELQVVRKTQLVSENPNRPRLHDAPLDPSFYAEFVLKGFTEGYEFLRAREEYLLGPESPFRKFLETPTRFVPTGTVVYSSLLRRSTHPDFSRRTAHRELLFAILAARIKHRPECVSLLEPEISALVRGDIPKFMAEPGSCSLRDDTGTEILNYFEKDAATTIRTRILSLDDENLGFQRELIRMGMATLKRAGEPGTEPAPPARIDDVEVSQDEVLEEVKRIAYRLKATAIISGLEVDWIGLAQGDVGGSTLGAVGFDLYDGTPGIGLFLAVAGKHANDATLIDMGRACAGSALKALKRRTGSIGGGYIGLASTAYATLVLAELYRERSWEKEAIDYLLDETITFRDDQFFDIVSGGAGVCAVLIKAYRQNGNQDLLAAAVRVADQLAGSKVKCKTGWGWPARNSSVPLTGFSHGAAGVGWALIHVGILSRRDDLVDCGNGAFDYERSVFSEGAGSWPDFRESVSPSGSGFSNAWCHGGPGIAISRATIPESRFFDEERSEVLTAILHLRSAPTAGSDCLCHGELGNCEALIHASPRLCEPDLMRLARRRVSAAIRRARRQGDWRCGTVPNLATPGLMTGMAGVGYGLLRCYFPDSAPSVLALA